MVALTRRNALAALVGTGALGIAAALPQCTRAALASEVDPIFAAIERHRTAWHRFIGPGIDDAEREGAGYVEQEAWDDFADTHPTTPAGLAAMAAYATHAPSGAEDVDNLLRAMRTIATVTAHFAAKAVAV